MEINSSNCWLCFTKTADLINIFKEESPNQSIASIITKHFWFDFKENDSSKSICPSCWLQVQNFHKFYIRVYNVHHEYFNEKVKHESFDKEPLANQNEPVKTEPTEECEPDLQSDKSSKDDDNSLGTTIFEIEVPKSKLTKLRNLKGEDDEMVERENRQIREYFKMECEICSMEFNEFQSVQTHYRREHALRGYLRCCNRKYTKRSLLVEHIQRHIDPNAFKCELCNKIYNDKKGLEGHMGRHKPTEERPYKCTDCPKSFIKKFLLVRHSYIHKNEEKTFICDECGKSFGTKTLLQTHKKNIHEGACIHICDICAKVFRSKLVFEQHHQSVHEKIILPKVQCEICGVWLKDKYYLKQHMDRHDESKVCCNICGNEYLNRKTLRNHIRSVHTNKSYECSMCEKTFKKSISLKEHMASHTGEVLYTCPYCPKTFNSSGNMYSHKKKHHPKEWEKHEKLKAIGAI